MRVSRRPVPRWVAPTVAVGLAAASLAACLPLLRAGPSDRDRFVAARGCGDLPQHAGLDGLGPVRDCRVLDRDQPWLGAVDARVTLLLDTGAGLAAVRIDFRGLDRGPQHTSEAVERAPEQVERWLDPGERERLAADVAARGGVRTAAWPLYRGDG